MLLAHVGGPVLAPLQLALPAAAAILYALRVRALAAGPRAVAPWRQACWYGGLGLIALTLTSPLAHIADELFAAHMAEHLLIADLGSLLLVLGLTGPLLAPVLRLPVLGRLRALTNPLVALPLWALSLYAWHLDALYVGSVDHAAVHALQHACFVAFGMAVWMPLFGPLPKPAWFGNGARLGYIVVVRLTGAVLANVLVWSQSVLYPGYAGERSYSLTALQDQQAAGAIMMVEGSLLTIGLFCWLFLRAAREGEERQELLDLAAVRGIELSDRRAARAVAAGRGAELRRRLEKAEL